ncbi:MAG: adenylate/guanylate cyclase domain-containing protein [Myxococcaceae bacterium]
MALERDPLERWLLMERRSTSGVEKLVEGFALQLVDAGFPIWRLRAAALAMHPNVYARAIQWQRGKPVTAEKATVDIMASSQYVGSPVERIHKGADVVHCRLDVPVEQLAFKHVADLKAQGGTDYVILSLVFGDGRRSFISFATDAKGGFTDEQVLRLQRLVPLLALRLELESALFATSTLLELYLGDKAADRVMAGEFRRGTGQLIRAAIWMCDLRGFTSLVDHTPVQQVVPVLDRYFECVARPVTARGGEILKFIGDAMLAVFPVTDDPAAACRNAVEAASAALKDFAEDEIAKKFNLRIGVAVNLGEVNFGNIGAQDRLDFTVIGAAVNETSRMESLCKALGTPLVLAANVAQHVQPRISLGVHPLRGVAQAPELFTLPDFAPSSTYAGKDPDSVS